MNETSREAIELVSDAFTGATGPAISRSPESGWWFEFEGEKIAKSLLDLDPRDVEYDDLVSPNNGSFVPTWTTGEGLMWLVPGVIRVCFEVDPKRGDNLLQCLFKDLHSRMRQGEIKLTPAQKRALLETHQRFYCSEDFGWNPEAHGHPLCELLNQSTEPNEGG